MQPGLTRATWVTQINLKQVDIRLGAVVVSLLLSVFTLLLPDTPNDDSYTYIRTADIFLSNGLTAAFDYYSWASFSVLVGLISKLGLSLFASAFLINALFYALIVYAFISIVREIDDSRDLLLWAAITILVYPQFNEYRYLVLRDVGFWALSLIAFWQYLRYATSASLITGACFCAALIGATLFRAEALIYLVLTPAALFFDTRISLPERRHRFLRLEMMVAGILLFAALAIALAGLNIVTLLLNFVSVYKPFLMNTFSPPPEQASVVGGILFGEYAAAYSQEYIGLFMAAGLFTILIVNLINGVGAPYLLMLCFGVLRRKPSANRSLVVPLVIYQTINAVVLLGFLFITRYLSSRYAMLFCLMLALLVPWILCHIWRARTERNRQLVLSLLILFVTYCAVDSFHSFGDSKQFVVDSVEWLAEHEAATPLLTNNHAIAYGSGIVIAYDKTQRYLDEAAIRDWPTGGVVAIERSFRMDEVLVRLETARVLERVAQFANPDDAEKGIVIYRRLPD